MADPIFDLPSVNPFGLRNVGFNARPIFVDIDKDGDLDIFVNGSANSLFMRNTGTVNHPIFAAAETNPFGLSVGVSAFGDIDGDGDLDAVAGNNFFRNTGTVNHPAFAAASIGTFGLNAGVSSLVDIDGDGDLDGFVGNSVGQILFSRNVGTITNPVFTFPETNPFGLWTVRYNATPTFVDIDGDGDLDAFVGSGEGYYSNGGHDLAFFRNTGTLTNPTFYFDSRNPFGLRSVDTRVNPTFVDIDGDGDMDAFVGTGGTYSGFGGGDTVFFQNIGIGFFPQFSSQISPLDDVGDHAAPALVDIDADGDLDAFVGNANGNVLFFRNTGTINSPVFAAAITNPFGLSNVGGSADPSLVDIDDDGDLDAFVGNGDGNTLFFKNLGTVSSPAFTTAINNPFGLIDVGFSAAPTFVDIDDDGDLDAFVGESGGSTLFSRNSGTTNTPVFATAINNPFGLSDVGFAASPTFVDIDDDGDLDAFVGEDHGSTLFFRNSGTASTPVFAAIFHPFGLRGVGADAKPTFADIDGDGDLDAFVGNAYDYNPHNNFEGGNTYFFINNHAPNTANLSADEIYTKNTPLNLTDIVVSDVDNDNIIAILTLSNTAAGSLNTATSGAVTSSFNASTGTWTASGALANVNALLAGLVFTPAPNFTGAFSMSTSISDNGATPLTGSKSFSIAVGGTGVLLASTPGNDILTGTISTNDTVTYASATAAVTVSLNLATQQNTLGAGLDTLTAIENLIGSDFNDRLTGNLQNNVLTGGAGNDILIGWTGADVLIGGTGDDSYFISAVSDNLIEELGEGTDKVNTSVTYTLPAHVENLILRDALAIDGTGNDLANNIEGNAANNKLNGKDGDDLLSGKGGNDGLQGGNGNDIVNGGADNDSIDGGDGDDTLNGGIGIDQLQGGFGNDIFFVDDVGDEVFDVTPAAAPGGIDKIYSSVNYRLPITVENLTLTGTLAINGMGNGLANIIIGNSGNNVLNGGPGNDTLNGGAGNDSLNGGAGTNSLVGGIGKDIFKFKTANHADMITDFVVVDDTLQLDNVVFTALTTTGTLAANQFRIGTKAVDGNDFVVYNNTTGQLLYDADGSGAGTAVPIAMMGVGLSLTNADIVVI